MLPHAFYVCVFLTMKVLHLNHSDINGGAARAAHRIHHSLRGYGIDSQMLVAVGESGDWTVKIYQQKGEGHEAASARNWRSPLRKVAAYG